MERILVVAALTLKLSGWSQTLGIDSYIGDTQVGW